MTASSDSDALNLGGRPPFVATEEMRETVEQSIAHGMNLRDVAAGIGCDESTLRKYFDEEIFAGRAKKRMEAIALLWKSAREGNVSAQKHLDTQIALSADFGVPNPTRRPSEQPREDKPGKKEMLVAAAQEPPPKGSKWSGLLN